MRTAWVGVLVVVCSLSPRPASAERLDLSALIERAREFPTVKAAGHKVDAARAVVDEVGRWIPPLEVSFGAMPIASIDCDPNEDMCVGTDRDDITFGVDGAALRVDARTVIPLYTFGKRSSGMRAARAATRAAEAEQSAARADVELDAARAYYALKLARELGAMLDEGIAYLDDEQRRIERHLAEQTGEATRTDSLRLDAARAEIEFRRAEVVRGETVALAAIRALVGDDTADIDAAPLAAIAAGASVAGARGSPEWRLADAGADAYAALAAVERSGLWPSLVFVGEATYSRASVADDPASAFANDPLNRSSLSAQVAIHWSFDLGLQLARRDGAEARAAMAGELAAAAKVGIAVEVDVASADVAAARDRLSAAETGEAAARTWLVAHQQAADVGLGDPEDFGDALRAYFEMRARRLEAIHDLNLAILEHARTTGAEIADFVGQ